MYRIQLRKLPYAVFQEVIRYAAIKRNIMTEGKIKVLAMSGRDDLTNLNHNTRIL